MFGFWTRATCPHTEAAAARRSASPVLLRLFTEHTRVVGPWRTKPCAGRPKLYLFGESCAWQPGACFVVFKVLLGRVFAVHRTERVGHLRARDTCLTFPGFEFLLVALVPRASCALCQDHAAHRTDRHPGRVDHKHLSEQ